jgi:hypothetical protein
MNKDESVEKTLREAGIFPPSVEDSHYGDKPEMTREEIIEKILREMSLYSSSEEGSHSSHKAGRLSAIIAEVRRRLPDGSIKTCGAFRHLKAGCCNSCHTEYPHTDMSLIGLPDGTHGWVCCAVEFAIYPERYAELMERSRNCPEGKLFIDMFGGEDRKKD